MIKPNIAYRVDHGRSLTQYLANAANPQYYNMTSHNIFRVDYGPIQRTAAAACVFTRFSVRANRLLFLQRERQPYQDLKV